jgi:hypothetical protein
MLDTIITFGFFTALWVWNWSTMQDVVRHEKAILELRARLAQRPETEESRCRLCADRSMCPAAFTGVSYPCQQFNDEEVEYGPEE